jgi:murein DD-endopeptidase MepM/ murein hydrolase activator NlpD
MCYASTEEDLLFDYGLISSKAENPITKESLSDLYVTYNSYKDMYYSKVAEEKIAPILYAEYENTEKSLDVDSLTEKKSDLEELLVAAVNADADIDEIFSIEEDYVKARDELNEATAALKDAYDKYVLASIIESDDTITEDMFYQSKNTYEGSLKIYAQYLNQYDIGQTSKIAYPVPDSKISTVYGTTKRDDTLINHKGIDFLATDNTQVNSALNGIVCKIGESEELGKYVIVSHGFNIQTLYGHLDTIDVKAHQSIKQGAKIGNLKPNSYCHFALFLQKVNSDPSRLFK